MFSRQELGAGLMKIISQNPENSSENQENLRFSVAPQTDTPAFKEWFGNSKVVDSDMKNWLILSP